MPDPHPTPSGERIVRIRKATNILRRGLDIGHEVEIKVRGEHAIDDDTARLRAWALWRRTFSPNENQMDWESTVEVADV